MKTKKMFLLILFAFCAISCSHSENSSSEEVSSSIHDPYFFEGTYVLKLDLYDFTKLYFSNCVFEFNNDGSCKCEWTLKNEQIEHVSLGTYQVLPDSDMYYFVGDWVDIRMDTEWTNNPYRNSKLALMDEGKSISVSTHERAPVDSEDETYVKIAGKFEKTK